VRKFLIKVNGVPYEVEVEDAGQAAVNYMPAAAPAMAAAAVAAPAVAAAPAPVAAAPAAPAAKPAGAAKTGSEVMKAPMPGTILNILAEAGQAVKKNQVVMVLEAMKMENEIVSPRDGVIAGFHATKGSSVNAGDLLFSLE
jgi:glutaconyl-CoA/methylmalonyl-CoA decarboxylase subunit gamma